MEFPNSSVNSIENSQKVAERSITNSIFPVKLDKLMVWENAISVHS